MNAKQRDSFPYTIKETEHSDIQIERIELVSCPLKEIICNVHLSTLNNSFLESKQYHKNRDFQKSIESLKIAFYKTIELMENPCTKCVQHFQTKIIESLEAIYGELNNIVKGIFGDKRFQQNLNTAVKLLKEFEDAVPNHTFNLREDKEKFLGNHLN
jgi:hypothetical protein